MVPGAIPQSYLDNQGNPINTGLLPENYPSYNEVLGTFALLESPKVSVKKTYIKGPCKDADTPKSFKFLTEDMLMFISTPSEVKINNNNLTYLIKLKEKLKYKFNPTFNVDPIKTQIYYSFIIHFEDRISQKEISNNLVYEASLERLIRPNIDTSHYTQRGLNYQSYINEDGFKNTIIKTRPTKVNNILNEPLFINFNYDLVGAQIQLTMMDGRSYGSKFETGYSPCKNGIHLNKVKKIELKLIVDAYSKNKGYKNKEINTLQVVTYEVYNANKKDDKLQSPTGKDTAQLGDATFYNQNTYNFNLKHQPGITVFDNIQLGPDTLSAYPFHKIIGNEIHIYVENALLKNNISVAPGYVAYIHPLGTAQNSGSSAWVKNLHIQPIDAKHLYYGEDIKESTDAEVAEFCASNRYKANKSIYKTAANSNSTVPNNNIKSVANIMCNLYPNPAKEQVSLYFLIPDQLYVQQVKILGLLGNVIEEFSYNANQYVKRGTIALNLNNYKAGLYFVCLSTNNGQQITQKLIINN